MIGDLHFRDYDPSWPARFSALQDDLMERLPADVGVEHVGSTAVPGLAAKDCIDLLVIAPPARLAATQSGLRALGYEERPDSFTDDPARWFWRLIVNEQRFAHAHLLLEGHPAAHEMIAVRDLLRRDPSWRQQYHHLKAALAATHEHDRTAYIDGKRDFVERLSAAARQE